MGEEIGESASSPDSKPIGIMQLLLKAWCSSN